MFMPRILIIEDERSIADSLLSGLKEHGFEAVAAYSGESGLDLFYEEPYDLLLLDINLEGIDGFEVCKKIRQRDTGVGIIMLTSLHAFFNKMTGYRAGADDYMVKPVEFEELLLKVNALLRRTMKDASDAASILTSSNLEMNLVSKEVRRDNTRINLTVKEFRLLEFLLRNKNKVMTRAEIAMHVWDIDFKTNTNVIDVYINYLRNKIDKDFSPKLIHTQTGVGFILKENDN
ncbi:MAG: response regulator transcription factor [Niastella sp.]|nr:response regulator transcription factor [Niastella sp.]